MIITATRKHKISCGHRVVGQGSKCENLHGHNYTFELTCESVTGTDDVGRVIDFGEIKHRICTWLEEKWDHRFLVWDEDPWREKLSLIDPTVVWVPFNPTAENMAEHMIKVVGPDTLKGTAVILVKCTIHETDNCFATVEGQLFTKATDEVVTDFKDFKVPFRTVGRTEEAR